MSSSPLAPGPISKIAGQRGDSALGGRNGGREASPRRERPRSAAVSPWPGEGNGEGERRREIAARAAQLAAADCTCSWLRSSACGQARARQLVWWSSRPLESPPASRSVSNHSIPQRADQAELRPDHMTPSGALNLPQPHTVPLKPSTRRKCVEFHAFFSHQLGRHSTSWWRDRSSSPTRRIQQESGTPFSPELPAEP